MGERGEVRRRVVVALVGIVAAAATIATSATSIDSRLEPSATASVTLSDSSPRAVGRFVLDLSPETLPVGTSSGPAPSGAATFTIGNPNGGGGAGAPVDLSATVVGIQEPPTTASGNPSWPIEELCRPAEPCHLEFDVSVEWLQPEPGKSIAVTVQANLLIDFREWASPPPGATAKWQAGEFASVAPRPTLTTELDLGNLTLGQDAPLAIRHVLLQGSAALLADPTGAEVTAYVASEPSGDQPPRAVVTITPDPAEAPDVPTPTSNPILAGVFLAPFADCSRAADCARGFTVIARWTGVAPVDQVDVAWSLHALARFPTGTKIPDGATLTANVDNRLDLGPGSPRLRGSAEGSFELQTSGNFTTGHLQLGVRAPAIRGAYLGADPPAIAILTLSADLTDPATPAGLRAVVSTAEGFTNRAVPLPDDGSTVQAVAFPLARCTNLGECAGSLGISIDGPAGRAATIHWRVTIDLPVPRPELAVGVLRIQVVNAP